MFYRLHRVARGGGDNIDETDVKVSRPSPLVSAKSGSKFELSPLADSSFVILYCNKNIKKRPSNKVMNQTASRWD